MSINIFELGLEAAFIYRELCSNRHNLIRKHLTRATCDDVNRVCMLVYTELAEVSRTPHLDDLYKSKVKDMQMSLMDIHTEVIKFKTNMDRIDSLLDDYQRYKETCELLGKHPLPSQEWEELNDNISQKLE